MTIPRDAILGVVALVLAGAYHTEATRIPKSLLEDGVGADGVPRVLAIAMAAVGAILLVRGLATWRSAEPARLPLRAHVRALGLLAILAGYVVVLPHLGYAVTIALLIGIVAAYAGARRWPTVVATAAGGAGVLLVLFKWLLGLPMPTGALGWL